MGRAIVRDPQVFLYDEPLSNLDAKLRVAMRSELKELHQRLKTTSVYVTHDQIEAMTMGDRIVVMKDGRIEQIGSPLDLYDYPTNVFVAGFIGSPAMNFVPATLRRNGGGGRARARRRHDAWRRRAAPAAATASRSFSARGPSTCSLASEGGIASRVVVMEPTGADTFVACRHGTHRHGGGLPRAPRLRARQHHPPRARPRRARTCSTPAAASASPPDDSRRRRELFTRSPQRLTQTGDPR